MDCNWVPSVVFHFFSNVLAYGILCIGSFFIYLSLVACFPLYVFYCICSTTFHKFKCCPFIKFSRRFSSGNWRDELWFKHLGVKIVVAAVVSQFYHYFPNGFRVFTYKIVSAKRSLHGSFICFFSIKNICYIVSIIYEPKFCTVLFDFGIWILLFDELLRMPISQQNHVISCVFCVSFCFRYCFFFEKRALVYFILFVVLFEQFQLQVPLLSIFFSQGTEFGSFLRLFFLVISRWGDYRDGRLPPADFLPFCSHKETFKKMKTIRSWNNTPSSSCFLFFPALMFFWFFAEKPHN